MAKASSSSGERTEYEWERLPDMPVGRCFTVGAYHEGKLYVIGGCDKFGHAVNTAMVYDFASRQWNSLPDMPRNRAAVTTAVIRDNKIIIVGGVDEKQVPVSAVDAYDIERARWEELPPLPLGVVGPVIELFNDELYVIGGTDKKECNQSVKFDFDKMEWFPLPEKPTACYACKGYLYNSKLYVIGGRNSQQHPCQECEAYDFATQQWEKKASMLSIRVFYNVVGIKDEIYVLGGLVPMVGVCKVVEKYNIKEDSWSRARDLPDIRSDGASGVVGGRIIVAGGLGTEKLTAMDLTESFYHKGKRFHHLPSLSVARSSMSSLVFDGKLAAMNGIGEGGAQPVIEILKVKPKATTKDKHT